MYFDNFSANVLKVEKGGLNHFQLSVLSTLCSSNSYPSEKDIVNLGGVLNLDIAKIRHFIHCQASQKLGRKQTALKSLTVKGDNKYLFVHVCRCTFRCTSSKGTKQ